MLIDDNFVTNEITTNTLFIERNISTDELDKIHRVILNNDKHWCKIYYDEESYQIGNWNFVDDELRIANEWECSNCKQLSFSKTNYCPHCGIRMEE